MKNFGVIALLVALAGCAGSPAQTGMRASDVKKNMATVTPDMTLEQFNKVMGPPDKTEVFRGKNNEVIMANIYMTEGLSMRDSDYVGDKNYTPFVFVDSKLMGWGWAMMNSMAQRYEFIFKRQ